MTQEVVVRLRDDFDQSTTSELGGIVATREFSFDNVDYEVDLSDDSHALMQADMQRWLDVARKRAKTRRHRTRKAKQTGESREIEPASNGKAPPEWTVGIHEWAARHGYDWDDKEVRQGVRIWAERVLGRSCRTGVIPRDVMEAHYKHKLQHQGFKADE